MPKHAADKPNAPSNGGRMKHFTSIARDESGPQQQTEVLQKRPREGREATRRAQEFLRIERGDRA